MAPALDATGITVVAPRSAPFLTALGQAQAILSSIEPSMTAQGPLEALADAWTDRYRRGERESSLLRDLREPRDLEARGIDPNAPFLVAIDPVERLIAFSFGLSDRPRFEQWLDRATRGRSRRIRLSGESARVVDRDSDHPVTCLARQRRAVCQLGAPPGPQPLELLERLTRGRRMKIPAGVAQAFTALEPDALAYVLIQPRTLANAASAVLAAEAARAHRFDPEPAQREAHEDARRQARKLERLAHKAEGGALAVYVRDHELEVAAEVVLTAEGQRRLRAGSGVESVPSIVRRWAHTPALVSVAARLHPELLSRLAAQYGLPLPAGALTGEVALLTLGVDSRCPLAKSASRRDELDWAFVLPTAVALGLKRAGSQDLYDGLVHALGAKSAPRPAYRDRARLSRGTLRGRTSGGRYEVDLTDDVLLASAGPGIGAAALRRLSTLPPQGAKEPPLLEASVDLAAVDAAFAGGSFSSEHRLELLELEALRLTLKPLLAHVRNVGLAVRTPAGGRRLSVRLGLKPPR